MADHEGGSAARAARARRADPLRRRLVRRRARLGGLDGDHHLARLRGRPTSTSSRRPARRCAGRCSSSGCSTARLRRRAPLRHGGDRPRRAGRSHVLRDEAAGHADERPDDPAVRPARPARAFCQMNAEQALQQMGALIGIGVVIDVAVTTAQALGIPIPVIPPGVSTAVTISIIVAALKLGGPGAVGDFLGSLCNRNSEATAALATWLTRDTLKPGQTFVDVAHRIMAPPNPGECAARGAGDRNGVRRLHGRSHRVPRRGDGDARHEAPGGDGARPGGAGGTSRCGSSGPSRAILSPQQSARTCTVEIIGLRSLPAPRRCSTSWRSWPPGTARSSTGGCSASRT